ncbi:hypothetical protein QTH49_13185 [Clostridium perfringens]|nr:hypothetical protein [Clostridium perfringens]MDM0528408.1 hypothetical protein [Clostridium perfringens]
MDWKELIVQVTSVGGNLGMTFLIAYTIVELAKITAFAILGYKGLKAIGLFIKTMFEY